MLEKEECYLDINVGPLRKISCCQWLLNKIIERFWDVLELLFGLLRLLMQIPPSSDPFLISFALLFLSRYNSEVIFAQYGQNGTVCTNQVKDLLKDGLDINLDTQGLG